MPVPLFYSQRINLIHPRSVTVRAVCRNLLMRLVTRVVRARARCNECWDETLNDRTVTARSGLITLLLM